MDNLELAIQEIKEKLPGLALYENEPMSAHCSFRIGGPVRALAVPQDVTGLTQICYLLKKHELAPYILGNGTNILFPDEGLKDLFIISTEKLTKLFLLPDGAIYAEAGVPLSRLAGFAQQNGLAGLEFASGIPGSVGGGLMMNAGAYGGELKDAVESVVIHFLPEQALYELTGEQCAFGYRSSFFQKMPGCVILSAVFRLEKGDPDKIAEAGLKGYAVGGAQVSEKHAGFVVNTGSATSHDVYDLMMHIRRTVYEHSKVVLEPEMIILPPDYKLEDHGPQVPLHRVWGVGESE